MPSFRRARESLTRRKFRLFKRRSRRLRASSSGPVEVPPIITSAADSLDLNDKGNGYTSVLISPSRIVTEVDAGIVSEDATPVKEIEESIGNSRLLNLKYEENEKYPTTVTPIVSAEERDCAANATNNSASLRGDEILGVESAEDEAKFGSEGGRGVAPVIEIAETTGSCEHLNLEYEENSPTIIPVVGADRADNAFDAVNIAVSLGENGIADEVKEIGTPVIETTEGTGPLDAQYTEDDQYPPIAITAEETDNGSGHVEEENINIDAEDTGEQYPPTIVSVGAFEESGSADNASNAAVESATELGAENKSEMFNVPIVEEKDSSELSEPLSEEYETDNNYPSVVTATLCVKETGEVSANGEETSEIVDIVGGAKMNTISESGKEQREIERKTDERVESHLDGNTANSDANASIKKGHAEEEETVAKYFGVISDDENEIATAIETEKPRKATEQVDSKDGDDNEQTSVPNPEIIGTAPACNNESAAQAHRFMVGDHVQVVKKGHKRHGMSGIVEKQTKCYVFFKEDKTNATIKIMPSSLVLSRETSSTERPIQSVFLHTEAQSDVTSSNSYVASLPSAKPTDFAVWSSVKVADEHSQHGGKEGTVRRHTAKFVVVSFKDSQPNKEVRISPKFLMRGEQMELSSTITALLSSDSESNDARGRGQRDEVNTTLQTMSIEREGPPQLGFGNYPLEKIILRNPHKAISALSAFQRIWGEGNYLNLEMPLGPHGPGSDLPVTQIVSDRVFELYHAKVDEDKPSFAKAKKVIAHYVHTNGLRAHEERLADFGTLSPSKIWARRKHFLSPATKLAFNKEYGVKAITANDIVMIEDLGTVGCGFISEKYLEELLGNNAEARRALGIQVRIFIPTKGIFKGMLMRKRNITEPIQLNESLLKVHPSRSAEASNGGLIVIKRTFPSKDNFQGVGRLFRDPEFLEKKLRPITKSFRDGLKKGTSCKLSPMYQRVLQGLGVTKEMLKIYIRQYQNNPEDLRHTHCIGMADPTNKLPPNAVFLTGTVNANAELDELFVSRSPCMEAEDGRVVQVVRMKPDGMGDDEWEWLQSLTFGAIIFGNPRPGERPLPELIADGDLDGDLYFVLWHKEILSQIQHAPITREELTAPNKDETTKEKEYDPDWFDKTQRFISRVPSLHADIDQLVGIMYKSSEAIVDIKDLGAVSFARAYKQALDTKKHGGPIILPMHLWEKVPKKFHKYLTN